MVADRPFLPMFNRTPGRSGCYGENGMAWFSPLLFAAPRRPEPLSQASRPAQRIRSPQRRHLGQCPVLDGNNHVAVRLDRLGFFRRSASARSSAGFGVISSGAFGVCPALSSPMRSVSAARRRASSVASPASTRVRSLAWAAFNASISRHRFDLG